MDPEDWKKYLDDQNLRKSSFGMDYATPGQLGGLGQGYVQPNLMYFGNTRMSVGELYNKMKYNPKLATELNKCAKTNNMQKFHKLLYK